MSMIAIAIAAGHLDSDADEYVPLFRWAQSTRHEASYLPELDSRSLEESIKSTTHYLFEIDGHNIEVKFPLTGLVLLPPLKNGPKTMFSEPRVSKILARLGRDSNLR